MGMCSDLEGFDCSFDTVFEAGSGTGLGTGFTVEDCDVEEDDFGF